VIVACIVFLVVADESTGRSVPFVFLERVKEDFKKRYEASIKNDERHPLADEDEDDDLFGDRFSVAYNLDREFGSVYSCNYLISLHCFALQLCSDSFLSPLIGPY